MLAVGDARWDIQAEWQLGGKASAPAPQDRIRFRLELSSLDPDWQAAVARARKLESATIDGVSARIELHKVELHFATYIDQTEPDGEASFEAVVEQPIPFPHSFDDPDFVKALARAANVAGDLRIQADEIEATERYWIFPIQQIGTTGVIVDRTHGRAFDISGSLDRMTWIWAYERGLLDEPAGDLIIERIFDPDRAFAALHQLARVYREDLESLPLVLRGCATWTAAARLKEADGALTWRVAPRAG
ncbi:MAG: hypothetical protein ACTHU0_13260 [Kofleriaceae bacterium]